jgi:peroxiredoxin
MYQLLFLALFQALPPAADRVRAGCSPDDEQISVVAFGDRVQVEAARAGDGETCYRITLSKEGRRAITGYVLGERLPAVAAFVSQREEISKEAAAAEALLTQAAQKNVDAKAEPNEAAKPPDPLISTQFEENLGRDQLGKVISLSSLRGRVTVVAFWSPKNRQGQDGLLAVAPLYNQFRRDGVAAVGISTDPNPARISETLDDAAPTFPVIADRSGLAARYNVDPKAGKVFVLDANHRIIAAGPMGPDIVKAVQQALNAPDGR